MLLASIAGRDITTESERTEELHVGGCYIGYFKTGYWAPHWMMKHKSLKVSLYIRGIQPTYRSDFSGTEQPKQN